MARPLILASALIEQLRLAILEHGDLPVMVDGYEGGFGTPSMEIIIVDLTNGSKVVSYYGPHDYGEDICALVLRCEGGDA